MENQRRKEMKYFITRQMYRFVYWLGNVEKRKKTGHYLDYPKPSKIEDYELQFAIKGLCRDLENEE